VAEERKKERFLCKSRKEKRNKEKCRNKCILVNVFITRWAELCEEIFK